MKREGRHLFTAILAFMILICLAAVPGCSKKYEEVAVTPAETTAEEETMTAAEIVLKTEDDEAETKAEDEEPEERIEVDGKIRSHLTGEMVEVEKANRRPLAIMMSNDKEALPQYGINHAGIVYEAPVEGAMNRYMALIEDYDDLERIGSVRSARTYYTYFAREYDAIFAHFGQSTFAEPYLNNVDNINGISGLGGAAFYRSSDRKSPHNAYTSGKRIKAAIEKMGYRTEYDSSYDGHFKFVTGSEEYKADSKDAYYVKPGYLLNNPWFEYQEDSGLYHRFQYGEHHYGDEKMITVKNIIFQYVQYGHYATTDYLNINLNSGGGGYYFTNGKYEKVTWKKDGEFGITRYYSNNTGEEIKLNKGRTWICIIGADRGDKVEIYGK